MALPRVGLDTKHGFAPTQGETAKNYARRDRTFSIGPGGDSWTWDVKANKWGAKKTTPAAPASPVPAAAPSKGGGGGGTAIAPSMAALGGGGMSGSGTSMDGAEGPTGLLNAPSRFRQGIGTRMMPVESAALASLRKIY